MGDVFDTARGIATVFQQRTDHCTLCWFDSSDSSDSNKDERETICGRVERSKQFEISDSLGIAFTSATLCFFVFFFRLPKHFCWTKVETSTRVSGWPCLCRFLRCSLFKHLDFQTCFPLCPDHRGKRADDAKGSVEREDRARRGACDSGQAQVVDLGRAVEGHHVVQDNHGWRCRLGRVHVTTTLEWCFLGVSGIPQRHVSAKA